MSLRNKRQLKKLSSSAMADDPPPEKKENVAPDVTPSPSLRKSSEAFNEQRKSIASPPDRASSERQESLLVARSILSDIVNCVAEGPSHQPPSEPDDEGTTQRRTPSRHSLNTLPAKCDPGEMAANSTFTVADAEENDLVDFREISGSAGDVSVVDKGNASLNKLGSKDQINTSWAGTLSNRGAAASRSSLLDDSPIRSELAFVRATDVSGTPGSILNITQSEANEVNSSVLLNFNESPKHHEASPKLSLKTPDSETHGLNRGASDAVAVIPEPPHTSPAGSGDHAADSVQESSDKGKTEGALPVDSEAGPEVAQFSEEEFLTAVQHFNEDLDFLQKVGSCPRLGRTSLGRCSQFLNSHPLRDFDPLNSPKVGIAPNEEVKPKKRVSVGSEADSTQVIELNTSGAKDLLNLSGFSPAKSEPLPVIEEQMFSEKEMSQALKYQELMFQERLLKKDQESVRKLESARQEYERVRIRLEERDEAFESQEKTLACLVKFNENLVAALDKLGKDIEKDRIDKDTTVQNLTKERDQLSEDLHNVEMTFADFHRRYEKAKHVISVMKENEVLLKSKLAEANAALAKNTEMVHEIRDKTEDHVKKSKQEVEDTKKLYEADITVLKGQLKKASMTINSLEKRLEQKSEENVELTKLYDELLSQVKSK